MPILLIAHRGDTVNFPENTIDSFRSALDKGADGIELDVQEQDGLCIVVHDYLYDRRKKYTRLEEVLREFGSAQRIEIEVKAFNRNIILPLKKAIGHRSTDNLEITTSVFPLMPSLRAALPRARFGAIFRKAMFESWMTDRFIAELISGQSELMDVQVAHVPPTTVSPELVNACHKKGIIVHSHIPSGSAPMQEKLLAQFDAWGVDQCTFDDIGLLALRKQ